MGKSYKRKQRTNRKTRRNKQTRKRGGGNLPKRVG